MSLIEKFHEFGPGSSVAAFVKLMAIEVDKIDKRLEPERRRDLSVPDMRPDEHSFQVRAAQMNGHGDLLNLLRDMAIGLDAVTDWMNERKDREVIAALPGKKRGRPSKHED